MSGKRRPPKKIGLTKADAARLGLAAARNALALTEESDTLAEAGANARAFALSVHAGEEIGKAWACAIAQTWGDEAEFWEVFWEVVEGHHIRKLDSGLFLEHLPSLALGRPPSELAGAIRDLVSKDVYSQKIRALYVDWRDERVVGPEEIQSDPDAQRTAENLRKSVVGWGIVLGLALESDLEKMGEPVPPDAWKDDEDESN